MTLILNFSHWYGTELWTADDHKGLALCDEGFERLLDNLGKINITSRYQLTISDQPLPGKFGRIALEKAPEECQCYPPKIAFDYSITHGQVTNDYTDSGIILIPPEIAEQLTRTTFFYSLLRVT